MLAGDQFIESGVADINTETHHVDLPALPQAGDLNAGDCDTRRGQINDVIERADTVVIGDGEMRNTARLRLRQQERRRFLAVGEIGVGMEIYLHGAGL